MGREGRRHQGISGRRRWRGARVRAKAEAGTMAQAAGAGAEAKLSNHTNHTNLATESMIACQNFKTKNMKNRRKKTDNFTNKSENKP